ncbi:MAG: multicopper oxidase domain-containing protein [Candidatus Sulfotelmatobacter sp.]
MPTRTTVLTLFLLALCVPLAAQSAQPFLSPPQLQATPTAGVVRALTSTISAAGCNPAGDISQVGNVVSVDLVVREDTNTIFNPSTRVQDQVRLRSYGGCLTGPLLEVHPGTTLRIHLTNNLAKADPTCPAGQDPPDGSAGCFNTINIHFHGLHVSPAGNSDNVLLNIAPHTQFDYEVNIPGDHPAGTFWYHAHRHGSTATQVASGASGALIIRGDRRYTGSTPGDIDTILHDASNKNFPEQVFLFQQMPYACFTDDKLTTIITNPDNTWSCPSGKVGIIENFGAQLSSPTIWDTSGRFTGINGAVQPTLTGVQAGVIQRWRMIHGGIHDTVNLQIVPMVASKDPRTSRAFEGIISGTPKEQAQIIAEICPSTSQPDNPVPLVPQFEIAADGLTRTHIGSIGIKDGVIETSVSGGIGTNFMQPGYRSDILLVFPREGTYCVLNQAATPAERESAGKGGQGTNETQLLATVVVKGGKAITGDPETYVRQALYDGNKNDKSLPPAALAGLKKGDLTPWRGMNDLQDEVVNPGVQHADFFIGTLPFPTAFPPNSPPFSQPNPPLGPWSAFGFYINKKVYDPERIDFIRQVGTTDNWELTSKGEPHIFHIHVNPFEVMDVQHNGKSIFGPTGECLEPPDSLGLQNQYCGMWHTFKDTVFVQNDYEVMIRTKYDRYIGEFVIHCHILDHEDSGMMTNVQIVPDLGAPGDGIGMTSMHERHSRMINNPTPKE